MGLALRPRLLILDEPTQGLADQEIADFLALIKSIASVTTILLIEHNMPAVMAAAHKITVFERGKILAEGPPEAIRADMRVKDAYLGHG
jgi:branched-chain amino acid transport system ATP-binding protein